jgi:hypothetical protein
MTPLLPLVAAVLLVALPVQGQAPTAAPLRSVANDAFGFGETLQYSVGYKFIRAGTAAFRIGKKPVRVNDRDCYDIRFEVASIPEFDWIYRVRDQYRTLIDIDGIFPWKFEQHIREGGFSKDFTARFDQIEHKAVTTEGTFEVPPFIHDIVSAFYFVRTYDLRAMKKGDVIDLQNFYDRDTHDLRVVFKGRQRIEVEAGIFNCIVIEPVIKGGDLFKSDGNSLIWLSDDARKIPVKVASKIPIGYIDAELTSYSGLRGPLPSRIGDSD